MFDIAAKDLRHQRVAGRAHVSLGPGARLQDLAQAGSAKAMLPRMHSRAPEIVFLNTAGGLTGGDRLDYGISLEDGLAVATTQTAERAYRSGGGEPACVSTRISIGSGATLHWLPQELIVFDGAALDRRLEVDMAPGSTCLMLETLVLGRAAMGETVQTLHLRDHRVVRQNRRPLLIEGVRLDAADLRRIGPAGLTNATSMASLSLLSHDAEDRLDRVRAGLPKDGPVRAAASAWAVSDTVRRLTVRFLSADAYALRRAVADAVATITQHPLPRVWQI